MHELKSGLAVAGAGLGAAALVAAVGMSVGGGPAAASPLAHRSLGATPAAHRIQARSTPTGSTGGSQKIGRCMAGNIEGSQASPDVGGHGPVLQDLHGYTPQKTSSSNMGPAANTGPGTGRLRPVGSPNWHPRPWSSHTSGNRGPSGKVRAGNIEGSQASPDVGGHGPVLQDLHGYTPQKTSSSNMGPAANTGPGTGRLRPVGSPNWHPRPWSSHTSACPTASGGAGDAAAAPVRFQ